MQDYKSDQEGVRCDRVSLRCMIPDDHLLVRIHESKELDSTREFATYAGLTPKHRVSGKVLYQRLVQLNYVKHYTFLL